MHGPGLAPPARRLPFGSKLAFGVGSIAYGIKDNGFSTFLLLFYNQVVGLPAATVGTTILAALMVEAFIVESVIPIHRTGAFGRIRGTSFLRMVERKLKWLVPRTRRVIEVIQPSLGEEETLS